MSRQRGLNDEEIGMLLGDGDEDDDGLEDPAISSDEEDEEPQVTEVTVVDGQMVDLVVLQEPPQPESPNSRQVTNTIFFYSIKPNGQMAQRETPPPLSECGGVPVCGRDVGQVVFVSLFIVFISF